MTTPPSGGPSSRRTAKVLVTGPPGAGTTTFIATLAGAAELVTGSEASPDGLPAATAAPHGTAMDVARLEVDDDLALVVHGVPGRIRSGFLLELLAEGMLGYLLLLDGSEPDRLAEARGLRRRFEAAYRVPSVVVLTRLAGDARASEDRVRDALELPTGVPVLTADTRDATEVRRAVVALLSEVLDRAAARAATRRVTRAVALDAHAGLGEAG